MGASTFNAGDNLASHSGGVEILLIASFIFSFIFSTDQNRDKLRPNETLGSYADFYILTGLLYQRSNSVAGGKKG